MRAMQMGFGAGGDWPSASPGDPPRPNQESALERIEFFIAQVAVFFAPYIAFRTPSAYLTISDMLFALVFLLRLGTGTLTRPLGEVTWLWVTGVILLISGMFIGSMANGDMWRAIEINGQYCFAYLIVPLALLGRPRHQLIRLIKCGVWGMAVMCAIGALIYSTGYTAGYGSRHMQMVTGGRRLSGFVDNPNGMAILTVMNVPLIWYLLIVGQIRRVTAFALMALLVLGIVLTSSNTGLIGLIAATVIFFVGRRNFKTLIVVAMLGAAGLFYGQNYLPETFQKRVLPAVTTGNISQAGTYEFRRELAIEAIGKAENHVVIGMGADQYRYNSEYGLPVHNTYLLLINEGGVLSLFGLLVIISTAVIAALVAPRRPDSSLVLLTAFTIAVVFANMIMGVAHIYGRAWMLSLLLAISPALARPLASPFVDRGPEHRARTGPRRIMPTAW